MKMLVLRFNQRYDEARDRLEDFSDWLHDNGVTFPAIIWGVAAVGLLILGKWFGPACFAMAAPAAWLSGFLTTATRIVDLEHDDGTPCTDPQCFYAGDDGTCRQNSV